VGTNIATKTENFLKASDKSWLGTRKGLQDMRSITLDISTFNAEHIEDGAIPSGIALAKITATGKYGPFEPGTEVNEVQSLVATGGTAGDFTLTFDGVATAAIAFDATAAAVKAALEALPSIDVGDVIVAGGPLPTTPVTIQFAGQYADTNPAALVVTDNVTNGNATITTPTPGGGSGAASDGREIALAGRIGHLFEAVKVEALTDPDVGAALFWTGVVKESRLPSFSGTGSGIGVVNTAFKAAIDQLIRYE
jgi:hypothetical protein